jgi:hypothetical protein
MEGAGAACPNDLLIGRRQSARYRLDMSARLVAAHENLRVQLEDISTGGAGIRLMHPRKLTTGYLHWIGLRAFGRVVWQNDLRCGLQFDEPLSERCLRQTIEFGEMIVNDASDKYGRLASAWVHGPGDW